MIECPDKGKDIGAVDHLGADGAPVLDQATSGDEDDHEKSGGDQAEAGEKAENESDSEDEFDNRDEPGHRSDEKAGEHAILEARLHLFNKAAKFGKADDGVKQKVYAEGDAGEEIRELGIRER